MPIEPNTAIKTGLALWEQRRLLAAPLQKLRRRLGRGKMVIAVFGPGGVGKTTLGTMLSADFDPQAKPETYKESLEPETYYLKSNPARSVLVAPGQEHRIGRYWPAIYTQLSQAKTAVVIHVAAHGYHAFNESVALAGSVEEYTAGRRKRELEILTDLASYLEKTTIPLKMLTLVTKQDLWWNEREDVKRHYESGEYAAQIARVRSTKGEQHFSHEFGYVSLCLNNLQAGDGALVAATTAGYDDNLRFANQQRVFEMIEGFAR